MRMCPARVNQTHEKQFEHWTSGDTAGPHQHQASCGIRWQLGIETEWMDWGSYGALRDLPLSMSGMFSGPSWSPEQAVRVSVATAGALPWLLCVWSSNSPPMQFHDHCHKCLLIFQTVHAFFYKLKIQDPNSSLEAYMLFQYIHNL